jgi:UDP:flavonoid glycosyltransferase YjiC (YdhE family)
VPVSGQFEQWINAYYLEKLGYGMMCTGTSGLEARLRLFLENLETYRSNLRARDFHGNKHAITWINRYVMRFTARKERTEDPAVRVPAVR